ncbi:Innexin-12 [Toxocara canis]|uniref:Innexin n=1 Tax=Toxocara canis TaxID=6265 RepID=A0A0B2VI23_TOXCA|nr:Innexin-12 [Toxocara canis]
MDLVRNVLRAVSPLPDGDLSDRINYCYSTTLLVLLSAFISGWSFVGTPIQCWFPAYYKGWWIEYALDYCYVQNTYFLPFTETKPDNYWDITQHIIPIPKNITERDERLIGYYQWVPFVLALQAILFYLPVVVWRAFYSSAVEAICETCNVKSNMAPEERSKNMQKIASFLAYERDIYDAFGGRIRRASFGRFLVTSYIVVKLLYALNALLQFLIIKRILGVDSVWWGGEVFNNLIQGLEWPETGNFPRVTLCDFAVRVLGNLHRHTVQCVLMINMFNEKIFVILWFWLLFIAFISSASFLYWTLTSVTHGTGRQMVSNYMEKIEPSAMRSERRRILIDEFVSEKLRPDGLFLLRLIQSNSGDIITCELVATLWHKFVSARTDPPPYSEPLLPTKTDISESDL